MHLSPLDIVVFVGFIVAVVSLGIYKSRHEEDSEAYFLAGRGLKWWLIGFSLIAANISTEQFVGMSGQAADYVGLAIASYEWMAAVTLVVVAFFFLPAFLRTGIYTIPEFLRHRYNETSRSIMAGFTMIIYVGVTIAAVVYSGALTIDTLFKGQEILGVPINVTTGGWIIGIIAAAYVTSGGLKACAWADLLQGSALIVGGAVIMWLAFSALGRAPVESLASTMPAGDLADNASGLTKFFALNSDKLHMKLPRTDQILPWTALVVGLWIPNFYYWGLNQYITQRTLGSRSLAEGQKGVVFAAALKLLIPFVIVFPGIMAFNLFSTDMAAKAGEDNTKILAQYEELRASGENPGYMVFEFDAHWQAGNAEKAEELAHFSEQTKAQAQVANVQVTAAKKLVGYKYDTAFGLLIGKLVPSGVGLQGFILAAILGAVVSSLAAMLNSASTIFTMDLYRQYVNRQATQKNLVLVGRLCVAVFMVIGCLIAPLLDDPKFGGIFTYIQEFQGFISPGILAVFVFGFLVRKAPPICGVIGLLINPPVYGLMKVLLPNLAFLDRMAVSFAGVLLIMGLITLIMPLSKPVELPVNTKIELQSSRGAKACGIAVVVTTLILYAYFW
ncbi:MAG: sodium/solute symporter [Phycisphaerae bacterium]|nr:sodium/solute symporter [Phycisphaerae bacterium]